MRQLVIPGKMKVMLDFLSRAPAGPVVEVGVYQGGSIVHFAKTGRLCFGYDTFSGMPEESALDNCHRKGDFGETSLESVQSSVSHFKNVTLVCGHYPASDMIKPQDIVMAHIDVDLYQSTLESLYHLWPRMIPGGRIFVDDAFQETCHGATLAFCEFCSGTKVPPHCIDNTYYVEKPHATSPSP